MAGALAGTLLIDITTNTAKLVEGFAKAEGQLKGFGDAVKRAGQGLVAAFSVGAVLAFGEAIQRNIDAMADMADNLKIPVEDFQALQNAALLAGQSMESTGTAIGKFNVFIGKASEGSKDQIERLNDLGVKILDVNGKLRPTAELLQEVSIAIGKISDPARRAAAEVDVFGKSGQSISAILPQFAKGTEELNRELSAMGLIHSPAVIKSLADMADQADKSKQRIEVLFAPFYAIVKEKTLEAIALGLGRINAGFQRMEGFAASGKIGAFLSGVFGAQGGTATLAARSEEYGKVITQIEAVTKELDGFDQRRQQSHFPNAPFFETQKKKLEADLAELEGRKATLEALMSHAPPVEVVAPPGGAGQPTIKTTGVDKYAEAMRKLKEETQATEAAIAEFNKLTAAGETGKEAARQAKLIEDIGKARSKVITDIPQGVDPKPLQDMAEALVRLKFNLDELKLSQQVADGVHKEFGDGTRELRDRMDDLNKAYSEGRISLTEYNDAAKDAVDIQEKQAIKTKEHADGIEGFVGGLQSSMKQMQDASTAFASGQQVFVGTWQLMSNAIEEFATTGQINFQKLASSFAKMLAEMVAKWLAAQLVLSGLKALGLATGTVAPGSGTLFSLPAPEPAPSGGMMAGGGNVRAGWSYMVGERGPERFVPDAAGRIEPHQGGDSNVTVNVDMGTTQGARNPSQALDFGRKLQVAIKDVIMNEKRPGGALYSRVTA